MNYNLGDEVFIKNINKKGVIVGIEKYIREKDRKNCEDVKEYFKKRGVFHGMLLPDMGGRIYEIRLSNGGLTKALDSEIK